MKTSTFKALSEITSNDPTKSILSTIFYNDAGYCATNGHIAGVYQHYKTDTFSTVDRDYGNLAHGYNSKIGTRTIAASRKIGKLSSQYELAERNPKALDPQTSMLPDSYPNLSQLIPQQGFSDKSITFTEKLIEPIAMLANQKNVKYVSIFIDLATEELVYVPKVLMDDKKTMTFTIRVKLDNKPETLNASIEPGKVIYLFSVDVGYMIDAWNLCTSVHSTKRMTVEFINDVRPMRFDSAPTYLAASKVFGLVMPVQMRDLKDADSYAGLSLGNDINCLTIN